MYSIQTLPSGLRILTAPSDGTKAVTVNIFVGAGSRYEEESERGISHFLEHMFFKGGKKYTSTKDVSITLDGVGGEFNAFTGKEYAGYYVKIASAHLDLACDVLSDMLLYATFPQEEIEKERGVIMEEERMYQDTPMYRAGWDFEILLLGDQPLGWDTIGTEKVIRSVRQKDFQLHKDLLYTVDNAVLVFAGNIQEKTALTLAKQYFAPIDGKRRRDFLPFKNFGTDHVYLRTKHTEQSHIVLGVPGVSAMDPNYFTQKILAIILGGNMSSRMFLNVREARGLCYYIATDVDNYLDAGSLSTSAGVDTSRLEEAIKAIKHEYLSCAQSGITDEELKRAKEYLKGKITLNLEDSEERAHFFGKQVLLYQTVRDIPEYFAEVDRVSAEQVNALAKKLLRVEELRLVVIGKEKDQQKLENLLKE
ncbi:insulinase family protein [Candidatus Peregrinibacteria bacterium]|nr:insulinase family protein [Candidatus Peregrinibacteria bacterium]